MQRLSKRLKQYRKREGLSVNRLAELTGISRRTLSRIEAQRNPVYPAIGGAKRDADNPSAIPSSEALAKGEALTPLSGGLAEAEAYTPSPRIAAKLSRYLTNVCHSEWSAPQAGAVEESYPCGNSSRMESAAADLLAPPSAAASPAAVVYHGARTRAEKMLEREIALLVGTPWRQLVRHRIAGVGERLREFRLRHDLTLRETAELAGISVTHLQAIETGAREPSPRSRFRLMRLLTVPLQRGTPARRGGEIPSVAEGLTIPIPNFRSSDFDFRQRLLTHLREQLALPAAPSRVPARRGGNPADYLRYLWLTSKGSTADLAASLDISQPHLIRLLRGDRAPSRKLSARIVALDPTKLV